MGALAFFFDPDIYGRSERRLEAANALIEASAFSLADIRRVIASQVALQYIEYQRANARLELLETTLDLQLRTLEIVQARFDAGLSAELDVDRAAADLFTTRAQKGPLVASLRESEYALAVLTGSVPQKQALADIGAAAIPGFVSGPPTGIPADLVRRRPDVRAAEAVFLAQTSLIGVEIADLYPSLTLPGTLRASVGTGSGFMDSLVGVLGASLDIPIFDKGRRRAEIEAQRARTDAALLRWRLAVLTSLQEVENALVAIEAQTDRRNDLLQAVESSQSAYEQLDALYREGLAGFIDVLDAQRTLIRSRQSFVDSSADLAAAVTRLYTALGTGAQVPEPA